MTVSHVEIHCTYMFCTLLCSKYSSLLPIPKFQSPFPSFQSPFPILNIPFPTPHFRFYPYHYAPFVSDIQGFSDLSIEFDLGEPFLSFEQLLAVLPPASKSLLPKTFQVMFCMPTVEPLYYGHPYDLRGP